MVHFYPQCNFYVLQFCVRLIIKLIQGNQESKECHLRTKTREGKQSHTTKKSKQPKQNVQRNKSK